MKALWIALVSVTAAVVLLTPQNLTASGEGPSPAPTSILPLSPQLIGDERNLLQADARQDLTGLTTNPENIEYVGHIGGWTWAVFVQGDYAYIGEGLQFAILDISAPDSPSILGKTEFLFQGLVTDIFVFDHYAYVTDLKQGLTIIDVSIPSSPIKVGTHEIDGGARSVAMSGDYAYVASGLQGLRVVDVSAPSLPVEVSVYGFRQDEFMDVAIDGEYAYLACVGRDLRVLDISVPTSPVEVGSGYWGQGYAEGIAVDGDYAYISSDWNGDFRVVDISNPSDPIAVGVLDTGNAKGRVTLVGNYAYLALGQLWIVDISVPTDPTELVIYATPSGVKDVAVVGDYAYIAGWVRGFITLDISYPSSPVEVGAYKPSVERNVCVSGDYAYVTGNDLELSIFDVSTPSRPFQVVTYDTPGNVNDLTVVGDYVYIADASQGLRILDVSTPSSPAEIGFYDTIIATRIAAIGTDVFVGGYSGELWIIDASIPSRPIVVGTMDTMVDIQDLFVAGDNVYIAGDDAGLRIIDISTPSSPIEVGAFYTESASNVVTSGNYAFVSDFGNGLRVVDVSTPSRPFEVTTYRSYSEASGLALDNQRLFVSFYESSIDVLDISTPTDPTRVGTYYYPAIRQQLAAVGSYIFSTYNLYGLTIFRYTGDDPKFAISGTVIDSTNSPIPNALVSAGTSVTGITDATGTFTISDLITGTYSLSVYKEGYTFTPSSRVIAVPPNATRVDFVSNYETIAPAAISDLSARPEGDSGTVILDWTAPGDDGNSGTATSYTVRYAEWPINTTFAWIAAKDIDGEPLPLQAGTPQDMMVSGLSPGAIYYFAIRSEDEMGNLSPLSNCSYVRVGSNAEPSVQLIGLEVTQGVQNWDNSVVLIQDRPTFVRAHVRSLSDTVNWVSAQLVGKRDGQELPGSPLRAANVGGSIDVYPNPDRSQINDSFYFELPASWRSGTVGLEMQGLSHPVSCVENAGIYGDCKVEVTYEDTPPLDVRLVGAMWRQSDGSVHAPTNADIAKLVSEIEATYPIPYLEWDHPYDFEMRLDDWIIDPLTMNIRLAEQRILDGCIDALGIGCQRIYVGVIVDPLGDTSLFGTGGVPPKTAAGFWLDTYKGRGILPHEIGHALGRFHTPFCGAKTPFWWHYPYADGHISSADSGDHAIYGFHNATKQIYDPNTGDLMSYCFPLWPSDWTYEALRSEIVDRYGSTMSIGSRDDFESIQSLVVSGVVTPALGKGDVRSVIGFSANAAVPPSTSGNYTLVLEGTAGIPLVAHQFEPELSCPQPSGDCLEDESIGLYTEVMPWNEQATRLSLLDNGQVLYTKAASHNAPVIAVNKPNGGEILDEAIAALSWTASDLDGDSLEYVVQYSPDDGGTWHTLVSGWSLTTYELDMGAIAGTDQGLLRVMASDGFHTTTDESDGLFTIRKHTPTASIQAPKESSLYVGSQTIVFRGGAFDNEDGQLGDSAIRWSSSIDGDLGTGQSLAINSLVFSEGAHTITLTAQDSDGETSTAMTSLEVYRDRPVLPATLSIAPRNMVFSAVEGSGQTVAEVLSIRNDGDGTMTWSAVTDQAWIHIESQNGSAPADSMVFADATGLIAGEYTGAISITASTGNVQLAEIRLAVREPVRIYLPTVLR